MTRTLQQQPDQAAQRSLAETDRRGAGSDNPGMVILGQVAGGVLHDFNNILTVVTGTIEMLAEAVADQPDLAAVARLIDGAASRGARLTSQLMALAQGHPPRCCDVDVHELLTDAGRLLRPTLGAEVEVAVRVAPATPTGFADPGQLLAALLCLGLMSRDAVAGGGRLDLEAAPAPGAVAAAPQRPQDLGGVAILLKAHVEDGAGEREDCVLPDLGVATDFVNRSNGQLKVLQSSWSGFAVEILLPRGEARPA